MTNNLIDGEQVIIKIRKSYTIFFIPIFLTITLYLIYPITVFLGLAYLLFEIVNYFMTTLTLTNIRVIGRIGILKISKIDIPLKDVNSIAIEKSLFGVISNYAKITISSHGNSIAFSDMKNAEAFRNSFYNI